MIENLTGRRAADRLTLSDPRLHGGSERRFCTAANGAHDPAGKGDGVQLWRRTAVDTATATWTVGRDRPN